MLKKTTWSWNPNQIAVEKRMFDIIVSVLLIVILSPLLFLIALAIKLESKGPILFYSRRIGKGYQEFNFIKFRSMYVDSEKKVNALFHENQYKTNSENAEEVISDFSLSNLRISDDKIESESTYQLVKIRSNNQSFFKMVNDPRVTKVGKWIRNTSIDELPQLFNVLKGEMSIVGNRPLPLYEAEKITEDEWIMRFSAPAGITGLWQVTDRGKKNVTPESRKQQDIIYASQNNFLLDIKILLKTPLAAIQHENV